MMKKIQPPPFTNIFIGPLSPNEKKTLVGIQHFQLNLKLNDKKVKKENVLYFKV